MALTFNSSEGGTPTVAVSTGNSGGASGTAWSAVTPGAGGSITYVADSFYRGRVGTRIVPATGVQGYVERSVTAARSGVLSMYFKFDSFAGTKVFVSARTAGGNVISGVAMANTGQFTSQDAAGTLSEWSTELVSPNVWYRLEWWWTNPSSSTGTSSFRVYQGDSTTPLMSYDHTGMNNGTSNCASLRIGAQTTSGAFGPHVIDDIAYNDGSTTPLGPRALASPDDYYIGSRGRLANTTGASTSVVDMPDASQISTGNMLVARIAVDNSGTSGAAPGITSISDPKGNVWTVAESATIDPGAASAGATVYVASAAVTSSYADGDDITITWTTGSPAAKAILIEEWTNIDTTTPVAVSNPNTGTSGSLSVAVTPTEADQLVMGVAAVEGPWGDPFSLDTDTTDGSWFALESLATDHATDANNVALRGVCKRVTGTSAQTWNATMTSRDWAAVALVFALPAPPDEPTPLETPEPLTVVVPDPTSPVANLSWPAIEHAGGYSIDVERYTGSGDPDTDPEDWVPLLSGYETDETGLTLTSELGGIANGVDYRARVTALVELSD